MDYIIENRVSAHSAYIKLDRNSISVFQENVDKKHKQT